MCVELKQILICTESLVSLHYIFTIDFLSFLFSKGELKEIKQDISSLRYMNSLKKKLRIQKTWQNLLENFGRNYQWGQIKRKAIDNAETFLKIHIIRSLDTLISNLFFQSATVTSFFKKKSSKITWVILSFEILLFNIYK